MSEAHYSVNACDQTSYGINPPNVPSPPSLTQSESNSSSSPPQPTTPPPRTRMRYPDLGRVPLHRRGTSGTYERLEDLLREAGYKETRVFTPDTERFEKPKTPNDNRNSLAGSVVGFLTGLIQRQPSALKQSTTEDRLSPPASPLAGRQRQRAPSISSLEGFGPTPKDKQQPHFPNYHDSSPTRTNQPPRSPIPPSQPLFHPRPSRASAYLRQMASHPSLQRPKSAMESREAMIHESDEDFPHSPRRGNGEAEEECPPPLPTTWLETVARAVLLGGVSGAYPGGPACTSEQKSPSSPVRTTPAVRQARSVMAKAHEHAKYQSRTSPQVHDRKVSRNRHNLSLHRTRSGLSDRTNRSRDLPLTSASTFATTTSGFSTSTHSSMYLQPPPFLSHVGRSRSSRSVGEISQARVVCKSAPASRATSMSRRASNERGEERPGLQRLASGKERVRGESNVGRKGRLQRGYSAGDVEGVPTLARTKIEGDDLWAKSGRPTRVVTDPDRGTRHLRGSPVDYPENDTTTGDDETSEDEELDLARMLVPSKRQNSIISLRKHLVVEGTASASLLALNERSISKTGYGSGNSRTFRQWMADYRTTSEDWEDEIQGMSTDGWGWHKGRKSRQRLDRGTLEDLDNEASFLEFLQEDRNSSRRGTMKSTTSDKIRRALPTAFVEETT